MFNGKDLEIYKEFATIGYNHPYADVPPFKMMICRLLTHPVAWDYLLLMLFGIYSWLLMRKGWRGIGLWLVTSPLVVKYFYCDAGDKIIYVILSILMIEFNSSVSYMLYALWTTISMFMIPKRKIDWIYSLIAVLSVHMADYPECILGYMRRGARMDYIAPIHQSIFTLLPSWLFYPKIFLAVFILISANLSWKWRVAIFNAAILLCRPENTLNAIIAAILPILYLIMTRDSKE